MRTNCHFNSDKYTLVVYFQGVSAPHVLTTFRVRLTDSEYINFPVGRLSQEHYRYLSYYQGKLLDRLLDVYIDEEITDAYVMI